MRSHIGWRGEQNILYKGVETSPSLARRVLKTLSENPKEEAQRRQYLLVVGLGCYILDSTILTLEVGENLMNSQPSSILEISLVVNVFSLLLSMKIASKVITQDGTVHFLDSTPVVGYKMGHLPKIFTLANVSL